MEEVQLSRKRASCRMNEKFGVGTPLRKLEGEDHWWARCSLPRPRPTMAALVGKEVEAFGLIGRADLNGVCGSVLAYDADKGRCAVRFSDAAAVLIKPSNLKPRLTEVPEAAEDPLVAAVSSLRIQQPELTAKELHAALTAGDWPGASLGDVKKAASKATKRAALMAGPPASAASEPVVAVAEFMPFEVGSVVTDAARNKFKVLKCKNGIARAVGRDGQRRELPQEGLTLIDTPRNTCPTGYELIMQSPSVGRIDRCDTLADMIAERAAPPQLMERPWDTFDATAQRSGGRTLEALATEAAWAVPPGLPPAPSRMLVFALDAVAHHLAIEWRAGRGWRVLQSFIKAREPTGYTALEWVTSARACGSANPSAHRRFGQGRWLSDAEFREFLRAIMRLRRAADAMVRDCLLPQTPFDIGPRPSEQDRPALNAWFKRVEPVPPWAGVKLGEMQMQGGTMIRSPGGEALVAVGNPTLGSVANLFRIPEAADLELNTAYIAITGEEFSALAYLRLLNYVESDNATFIKGERGLQHERERKEERERLFEVSKLMAQPLGTPVNGPGADDRSNMGWAVKCILWAED